MNYQAKTTEWQQVKEYLEAVVNAIQVPPVRANWTYQRYEELVLKCGFPMESKPLPEAIEVTSPRFCYWNCQQLALANRKLTYIEGYALHPDVGFPIAHAWLLDSDFRAIDPTWETPGCYFGVPLSTSWVQSVVAARNRDDNLSILDGNYLEGFSLLKDGFPTGALANLQR